jgi:hypothetical protein
MGWAPGSFCGVIEFTARRDCVGFVVDSVAPVQVFLGIIQVYSARIILSMLYLFIYLFI